MTVAMKTARLLSRTRVHLALPLLVLLAALALPAGAGAAIKLQIVNQTGRGDVYVTVHGGGYEVEGAAEDEAKQLSSSSESPLELTVDKLISGRVYVSFGSPVTEGVTFESPTRFDWAELTVTPAPADVANLTAVDQFAIGMRMEALNGSGENLETLGEANASTIFNALQQIPGGAEATVRNGQGEILRVLSPVHSSSYPPLAEYVKSLAGQTLTLHTGLFQNPFGVSEYKAVVNADGSVTLNGSYEAEAPLAEPPPPTITIPAGQLLSEIYAPTTEHNNFEAAIRRDLLAGFSTGFWGGKYGNDALSFCTNAVAKLGGHVCPEGFNQPAFGDARASLSPYPTCEQYAAVINQYSDSYGSAYSDAAKKVAVSLDQEGPTPTKTLRLTILPDSGSAMPVHSGNPNCGAASGGGGKGAKPKVRFLKKAKVKHGKARVARLACSGACGQVKAVARHGKKVVARASVTARSAKPWVVLHLTKSGRRLLARSRSLAAKVSLVVTPASGSPARFQHAVKLLAR
jgi:hypothetical protein